MKARALIILLVFSLMAMSVPTFAALTEKKEVKEEQAKQKQLQEFLKPVQLPKGEILFYADFYEGYDNNVNLDSTRKGDTYTELALDAGYKQPFGNGFDVTLDYYLSAITYHELTDGSFYDSNLSVEFDKKLTSLPFRFSLSSNLEYNYYPKDESARFYAIEPETFIRHDINDNIYQKLVYSFMFKEYTDRSPQDGAGASKPGDRKDLRNSLTHELNFILFNEYILKLRNQYSVNDSNDQYLDYYDYDTYRIDATVIMPVFPVLFKNLYGLLNCGYQFRDYKTRTLVADTSKTQEDDFYNVLSALIYDLNDAFSVSFNYTYNQNESNEPSEKYSGSTYSLGLHYAF